MAQIESGGGGGRKSNVELNLVPFIDLMSVLITFLLITAVWTQVSMIQLGTSIYGKKDQDQKAQVTPDIDQIVKLEIKNSGFSVVMGIKKIEIPKLATGYDLEKLSGQLQAAKQMFPQKLDAIIAMDEDLSYEHLINGMDSLLKAGFPQVTVATGGPN
jgi:biopolymer transport protein ExbD